MVLILLIVLSILDICVIVMIFVLLLIVCLIFLMFNLLLVVIGINFNVVFLCFVNCC